MEHWSVYGVLVQHRIAVFPLLAGGHLAAQLMDQGLHPIADTQDGETLLKDPAWHQGSTGVIHAGRSAGEYDALGIHVLHRLPRGGRRQDLGVDLKLPDSSSNQMTVLGAEVNDDDTFTNRLSARFNFGRRTF